MDTPPHLRRVPSTRKNKKLEDDAEISESGLAVQPEIPCFVWIARGGKITELYLPRKVIDKYHLKIPNIISFVDERGREWDVKVSKHIKRLRCSRVGWRSLCDANLIDVGDLCICEFMQGSIDLYIRVRIIRAHELPSSSANQIYAYSVQIKRVNKKLKATHCHDADIFISGQAFRLENPNFVWISTKGKRRRLILPRTVINNYNLKIPNIVSLVDERGKKWETEIGKWRDGSLVCPGTVWRSLCDANLIETGDICICEFVEGQSGLSIFIRVARAHTLTRKKDVEEEEVDEESLYENDWDENAQDESGMQRNILEGKHKLNSASSRTHVRRCLRKKNASCGKKGFEEEKCAKTDKDTFGFNLPNCNDCDESGTEVNISKAKRKFKSPSSHAPAKRSARKDKTFDRRKDIEEEKIKRIEEETMYLDPPEERQWKTEDAAQRSIEDQDAYIKKLKGIIKTLTSNDVNQKRAKFSCHKDDSISSGSDIKLIDRHISLQGTPMMTKCLPEKLELLQSYFLLVRGKAGQSITLYDDVFGKKYKIYIFLEDVNKFCLLEPISDCCIISYMWYLHKKMKKENILTRFRFVNPNSISNMSTKDQRAHALADRLIGASTDQLVLAPCNVGFHWILTVIQPYNKIVFLLDPLSHRIRDRVWQDVVNRALSMFCASKGDNEKKSPTWVVVKAPLQPDSKQCGFYIMQYMRKIIETCRDLGSSSLQSMFTKDSYSRSEIDEMRIEWAECVLDQFG